MFRCTKRLPAATFLAVAFVTQLSAGTITPDAGSIFGVLTFDNTFTTVTSLTINGFGTVGVNDSITTSTVILTDGGAPAPNFFLTAANTGVSEFLTLGFDPLSLFLAPDLSFFVISASGVPVGAVSDPGLAALTGTTSWVFGFVAGGPGQTDITYAFVSGTANDSSSVPEPTTMVLSGVALAVTGLMRRFRCR